MSLLNLCTFARVLSLQLQGEIGDELDGLINRFVTEAPIESAEA